MWKLLLGALSYFFKTVCANSMCVRVSHLRTISVVLLEIHKTLVVLYAIVFVLNTLSTSK